MTIAPARIRLTQYAHGGGCACKIPPGELEAVVAGLTATGPRRPRTPNWSSASTTATTRRWSASPAARAWCSPPTSSPPSSTTPYTFGRIAAANALSDVYAMGGTPVVAVNLLGWPRDVLPAELAAEVLRGGLEVAQEAGCHVGGGHSIDDPEPKYGMAVTGLVDLDRIIRNDAAVAGTALSLTKPLGVGVLNSRMKATGEVSEEAVASMTALNREAGRAAVAAGIRAGTDVTGFGLLGHLYKMARASGVTAVVDAAAVPYLAGARQALADGFVSGGTRRNLDWVRPHTDLSAVSEDEALLLADAQTSGGLLLGGEIPGAPVIGEFVPRGEYVVVVR